MGESQSCQDAQSSFFDTYELAGCELHACETVYKATSSVEKVEQGIRQLFALHDLNEDGQISEGELIKLNEKVAMLHHGAQCDIVKVKQKYTHVFRQNLDSEGRPVNFARFRGYIVTILNAHDSDVASQEMIVESLVLEARLARQAFRDVERRNSDLPFLRALALDSRSLGASSEVSSWQDVALQAEVGAKMQAGGDLERDELSETWVSI